MLNIMVSAGEVSGDMHAAAVIKELKEKTKALDIEVNVFGMGSTALKKAGAEIIIDPTEISTIGYLEAFKNLRTHFKHLKKLKELLKERKPDLVFLVDYSAFNMKLAKACAKEGIKAVNYFPPTAWIYNKGRAKKLADYGTHIAAVLPMERDVYRQAGAEVTFVGHPLLDLVKVEGDKNSIKADFKIRKKKKVIGLFPGSRRGEIKALLPEILKAAQRLDENFDHLSFVLAAAEGVKDEFLKEFTDDFKLDLKIVRDNNYRLMEAAEFLITASGTTTLEAAILTTPHIIVYKSSLSTYLLAKYFFKIEFIGKPNIIAGKQILPELLQQECTAENIYVQAEEWLNYKGLLVEAERKLREVKEKLGGGGAVKKTAELLLAEGGLKGNG
ncbi:lipid-A-disaccharide synthase [Halanaerobium hydrogeniformans]|uniref:Lipid-A-disaccharide synthase n=1 Tax=Halanaerobium hydrogeniformans TaxID=656519 RepID=E4RP73_HALHG|nr:lipid-A-disaccharide synthase [Halanaerobium hydrogeniformans]ADQ13898.1 lipid-A-disaccharide synthase [Halanaerobium hydrogeniformans]